MILVTGASGLVGGEVAERLAGRGAVRLALRDPGAGTARGAERARFDFRDRSTFADALHGVDRVFLLRPPQLADARRDFAPFVEAMRHAGVRHVAFLSVRGAERTALLPHRRIEQLLEGSGVGWTHLRPNDFTQNFATVHAADIRDRNGIWTPAGRGQTSFVDARDVAEVAARVLAEPERHAGRAYTLTGAEALDMYEVADILTRVLGRRIAYRDPSVPAFLLHCRRTGRPFALGLVMTAVYTVARLGWAAAVEPDLGRLLGRQPLHLEDFVRENIALFGGAVSGSEAPVDHLVATTDGQKKRRATGEASTTPGVPRTVAAAGPASRFRPAATGRAKGEWPIWPWPY